MNSRFYLLFLVIVSPSLQASVCDQSWLHIAGLSKHVEVYKPTEYTKFKRETHPGFGMECQKKKNTFALGEFTNSLDRPFQYITASHRTFKYYDFSLYTGLMAGKYGRTEREPLKIITPIAFLEYQYKIVGLNFFALPPAKGFNDYAIFYTQFKLRF